MISPQRRWNTGHSCHGSRPDGTGQAIEASRQGLDKARLQHCRGPVNFPNGVESAVAYWSPCLPGVWPLIRQEFSPEFADFIEANLHRAKESQIEA